jgi:protein SCO1/2
MMNTLKSLISIGLAGLLVISCGRKEERLPYLGNVEIVGKDTIYHTVPDISLTDQDSLPLHISSYKDKLILADFFFTSCPSICPKVKKQMLRMYDRYKDDNRVLFISHTIDQRNDSVAVLHRYAYNLGVDTDKWKFVTGVKDSIYYLADQYFVSVVEDPLAPKGFDHSGRIIMIDQNRRVRGYCEGTDPESVTAFFDTIDRLLKEEYNDDKKLKN